jgi:hypothetical protein
MDEEVVKLLMAGLGFEVREDPLALLFTAGSRFGAAGGVFGGGPLGFRSAAEVLAPNPAAYSHGARVVAAFAGAGFPAHARLRSKVEGSLDGAPRNIANLCMISGWVRNCNRGGGFSPAARPQRHKDSMTRSKAGGGWRPLGDDFRNLQVMVPDGQDASAFRDRLMHTAEAALRGCGYRTAKPTEAPSRSLASCPAGRWVTVYDSAGTGGMQTRTLLKSWPWSFPGWRRSWMSTYRTRVYCSSGFTAMGAVWTASLRRRASVSAGPRWKSKLLREGGG